MKTGRVKLYMIAGLTVLLLVATLLFMALYPAELNTGLWLMFSLVILLAIMASVFMFIGLKRIKVRVSNLPKPYAKAYIDAQEQIALSSMTRLMKHETQEMVLEIFEHAVLDGRKLKDVIKGDLKGFVQGFITEAGGEPNMLYWFSYSSLLFVGYLLFMKLYKVIRVGYFNTDLFKTETLDVGITLSYGLIACLFFPWLMIVMRKAASEQWEGSKRIMTLLPFSVPFLIFGALIGIKDEVIRGFLDAPFVIFGTLYHFVTGIAVLVILIFLMKYAQRMQLRE